MKNNQSKILGLLLLCIVYSSCNKNEKEPQGDLDSSEHVVDQEDTMRAIMQKHMDAVTNKDLVTLESTMSPKGNMQLILPGSEIINGVDGFMSYHKDWFAVDNGWTFETKILNTKVGETFGMAIVEIVYREPERDGVPYFNRMIVSYDLEKMDGAWYIVKDHASSIEKSTDPKN